MANFTINTQRIVRIPARPESLRFRSEEELKLFYEDSEVREALYLSSPQLYEKYLKWINQTLKAEEHEKLVFSLLKYAIRMSTRPTPFGLFAGCGVVKNHQSELNPALFYRRTRLDLSYLNSLLQHFSRQPYSANHVLYFPNTSIYRRFDKFRYVEYSYENSRRVHKISAVDYSEYLEAILERAHEGASLKDLAQTITDEEISLEEALEFISELIENQLIVSELEPGLTGDDQLEELIDKLSKIRQLHPNDALSKAISDLEKLSKLLLKLDEKVGNPVEDYQTLLTHIEQLGVPFDPAKLFQTDKYFQADSSGDIRGELDETIDKNLRQTVELMARLTPKFENGNLKKFKEKFAERYEEKWVPLTEALDPESGIGYASKDTFSIEINELTDDIPVIMGSNDSMSVKWHAHDGFVLKKLLNAIANDEMEITISPEELKQNTSVESELPPTTVIMYSLVGTENDQPVLSIELIGGVTANNLISRFSTGNEAIFELTKQISNYEELHYPGKIIATIVHLPESRTGNVLYRRPSRTHEIQYLSNSGVTVNNRILPSDLWITVRNNRILLYSRKHRAEIIPRLDTAHNYANNSLPIYHFLCDLQSEGMQSGLFISWGIMQNQLNFLPRVKINNVIVERARWSLSKEDYNELLVAKSLPEAIETWRNKWKIPQHIYLVYGDNELLVDLANELNVRMFIHEIKKYDVIVIREQLQSASGSPVKDSAGNNYSNQFIALLEKEIPSVTDESNLRSINNVSNEQPGSVRRSFPVGSEWLYYKLYVGANTADQLLTEVIAPLMQQLQVENQIKNWFFIRYADPNMHIRLRLHLENTEHVGTVIGKMNDALHDFLENNVVHNVVIDTYQREIERYGTHTIASCERLFGAESADILEYLRIKPDQKNRWLYAMASIRQLLHCFGYQTESMIKLLDQLQDAFWKEYGSSKRVKDKLNSKYRLYRQEIEQLLSGEIGAFRTTHQEKLQESANEIVQFYNNNPSSVPMDQLLSSIIHMKMNRMFRSKQRVYELVVYYFMWKAFVSIHARELKSLNAKVVD